MSLVISTGIRNKEFKRGEISAEDLKVLIASARESLTTPIKGERLPKGTRLLKAYAIHHPEQNASCI